jgi:hypothetical protein
MGRPSSDEPFDPNYTIEFFKVRPVDGDHDDGGAYWGFGPDSEPLFCFRQEGEYDFIEKFIRAPDIHTAIKEMGLDR